MAKEGSPEQTTISLSLEELLPDKGNEIVLEGSVDGVVIVTDQPVVASGTAQPHVTASGVDVTGYNYYALQSGVTLYAESSLIVSTG